MLLLLQEEFGTKSFIIDDEAPVGEGAIYLQHNEYPDVRAYVYTIGQRENRYAVHLEFPQQSVSASLMEVHENLNFKSLSNTLSAHLDLICVTPLTN